MNFFKEYIKVAHKSLRTENLESNNLQIQLKEINLENDKRASEINRRKIEYDKLVGENVELRKALDYMATERKVMFEELQNVISKCAFLKHENKRMNNIENYLDQSIYEANLVGYKQFLENMENTQHQQAV